MRRAKSAAHPRSRGENRCLIRGVRCEAGSSPLTRGKRDREHADYDKRRLIPAHAGKTSSVGTVKPRDPAHPRSRGENDEASSILGNLAGSSPLTRGKRHQSLTNMGVRRLIPAHAGKTS